MGEWATSWSVATASTRVITSLSIMDPGGNPASVVSPIPIAEKK